MRLHNLFVYCAYVIGSWLCIGLPMTINGSGLGRCPKYPSMPRFNLGRVSAYNLMSLLFTIVILHLVPLHILNLKELACLKYQSECKLVGKRWVSTYILCYSTDRYLLEYIHSITSHGAWIRELCLFYHHVTKQLITICKKTNQ